MRILLASSEVQPYSKSGGLADMVGGLAKALAKAGHQVGVVTPLYRGIREKFPALRLLDWRFDMLLGADRVQGGVSVLEPADNLTIYFVEQPQFFDRRNLYQENGVDYADNAARFIFFSKCVANLARYLPWRPEIVHVHDWQVGVVPMLMLDQHRRDGWSTAPPMCLTIHNLAYQGNFPRATYALTNLPDDYFHPGGAEFYGGLNCLKAGIVYADALTTVSPRYAREITTELFGCGLDGMLRARQSALTGILNGVDDEEWRTTGNPFLPHAYSVRNLRGKAADKLELQKELGLPMSADVPLFGTVTRLVGQKGVHLLLGALEEMLAADMQFVLLGSGDAPFENAFQELARRHPRKVAVKIGFNLGLSHRIEAGCDFYLMPSVFEPCGLNQMYSLRYGTVPIVRVTGGLDDSVIDPAEDEARADGIKFAEPSVRALAKAIRKALVLFSDRPLLQHFRRNGMQEDFSVERMADEYARVYRRLRAR
ncbi:MAG: glycogen synthase GlgA [Verrucomicrobia bacterium]|nr:glycogen synthase GlgA [Verrucomicrobiota bacterium]